ncbi:unnamed protein product [Amoebophrya sp. A120]|nr:unnamed protein product [Amoebophrya sp. A120]|eukprot:GSA120T00014725001.1
MPPKGSMKVVGAARPAMKVAMKQVGRPPMKKMNAMKKAGGAKPMKKKAMKKVSKIAKGKRAKSSVYRGTKEKTTGGLKKDDLRKNKNGKVVSVKASNAGKKKFKFIKMWTDSVVQARKYLEIRGFCPIGGNSARGKSFLYKIRSFYQFKKNYESAQLPLPLICICKSLNASASLWHCMHERFRKSKQYYNRRMKNLSCTGSTCAELVFVLLFMQYK